MSNFLTNRELKNRGPLVYWTSTAREADTKVQYKIKYKYELETDIYIYTLVAPETKLVRIPLPSVILIKICLLLIFAQKTDLLVKSYTRSVQCIHKPLSHGYCISV